MFRSVSCAVCSVLLSCAIAFGGPPVPPEPCVATLVSCDYGYHVGDHISSYTHWCFRYDDQTLASTTKVPQLRCKDNAEVVERLVSTRFCEPTTITRTFRTPLSRPETRCTAVEVAFAETRCCVDCCGRVYQCVHVKQPIVVEEPNLHIRRIHGSLETSAHAVRCSDIEQPSQFQRNTTECKIFELPVTVSVQAKKQIALAQRQPISTGVVTLTKTPKVCAVPFVVAAFPPCELECIGCRHTRRETPPSAAEPISTPPINMPPAPAPPTGP